MNEPLRVRWHNVAPEGSVFTELARASTGLEGRFEGIRTMEVEVVAPRAGGCHVRLAIDLDGEPVEVLRRTPSRFVADDLRRALVEAFEAAGRRLGEAAGALS